MESEMLQNLVGNFPIAGALIYLLYKQQEYDRRREENDKKREEANRNSILEHQKQFQEAVYRQQQDYKTLIAQTMGQIENMFIKIEHMGDKFTQSLSDKDKHMETLAERCHVTQDKISVSMQKSTLVIAELSQTMALSYQIHESLKKELETLKRKKQNGKDGDSTNNQTN